MQTGEAVSLSELTSLSFSTQAVKLQQANHIRLCCRLGLNLPHRHVLCFEKLAQLLAFVTPELQSETQTGVWDVWSHSDLLHRVVIRVHGNNSSDLLARVQERKF